MDKTFLYKQIIESVRQEILQKVLQSGDRLPSVREMAARWNCTIGTVQKAYEELARQGLVVSRPGQGTSVIGAIPTEEAIPLRRAALVHRVVTNCHGCLRELEQAKYEAQDFDEQ